MLKDEIKKCIKYGNFVLTSGRKSSYYIDLKEIITKPHVLNEIIERICGIVRDFDKVAGIELGSIPIAVALSLKTNKEYIIIRKKEKKHGIKKLYEGNIERGDVVLIVDDVSTTGGSILRAANILRKEGAIVKEAAVVVDREEGARELLRKNGIELKYIFTSKDLIQD